MIGIVIVPTRFHKESTMKKQTLIVSVLFIALSLPPGLAFTADPPEQIYGSQLMTQQERIEYRAKLRAAKTVEERERIRKEHHERMKERAEAHGMVLPDEPPARGSGMKSGGGGMGSGGGGMGPGSGRDR